jgi:hypothetical protein
MELKVHKFSLSSITGLLAVLIFVAFTFTSLALYPVPYNPLYNWLSNLGNINLNPLGAVFFNSGCIISGLVLIPFFAGLYIWKPARKWSKILLLLGEILGILGSISLIMVGVYPETSIHQHIFASTGVFGSLFIIVVLLSMALYNNPKFIRGVAYYGLIPIVVDLSFLYVLSLYNNILAYYHSPVPVPGLEWAIVFSSLLWVGLLSVNMLIKKV